MAQSSEKPKLSLRLVIDKEKNRVVLGEASKDFIDVLCSLLTFPIGTIVRLLEKHQNPQSSSVGCFTNLYKSVLDMDVDHFETEACKHLFLYPKSTKETRCKRLKLNIEDTEETKNTLVAGVRIPKLIPVDPKSSCTGFVKGKTTFIISDDLVVTAMNSSSTISLLSKLQMNISDIEEQVISIGKAQAVSLQRASLITTSALTNGLSNFLSKMKPNEATQSASKQLLPRRCL